jgi:hypothetical protein
MKKKVVALIVILIMSISVFTACHSNITNPNVETNEPNIEDLENLPEDQNQLEEVDQQFVLENEAFKILEPAPNTEVEDSIVVRGLARVFEGTIHYELEDGHFMLDKGFTTATEGAPGWGEFEIVIDLDKLASGPVRVILYEESAKDGSRLHELLIPLNVKSQFVLENEAFKILEPAPNTEVEDSIVVRGLARVFEGTIQYELEDGHNILAKGFTTATEGAPGWGEFEIVIEIDKVPTNGVGIVVLYEESAKDGSRLHELSIPVNVTD